MNPRVSFRAAQKTVGAVLEGGGGLATLKKKIREALVKCL
jgi:hypothetical protein